MNIVESIFWVFAVLVFYVYFGYPLLLWTVKKVTGGKSISHGDYTPKVTLVISAFNEADVIDAKILNSLEIDYPKEKLEILVVSDASDDGTDDIVLNYESDGVVLLRMNERGGKTLGLNEAVTTAIGEVIIFSDANAMYRPDAVRAMLRNFNDPGVGAVVGESTYSDSENDAEKSESAYWRYEVAIKRLESELGSVVGGDGAIYAIRKDLYRPMAADALSDFVNPCQIVEQGKRCIYEPAAVSIEEAAGSFDKEFLRKVRIVNRAWRATMSMRRLLNPIRFGLFSLQLLSHKVLRWLVPLILMALLVTNFLLASSQSIYKMLFVLQMMFYAMALSGAILRFYRELPSILYIPFYFCLVNTASALGILEAYLGKTYTTWTTPRTDV